MENKQKNIDQINIKKYKKNKNIYIILFILLMIPMVIIGASYHSIFIENPVLNQNLTDTLGLIITVIIIALTYWYARELKIKIVWAVLLSLCNLIPFMILVPFIIFTLFFNVNNYKFQKHIKEEISPNKKPIVIKIIIVILVVLLIYIGINLLVRVFIKDCPYELKECPGGFVVYRNPFSKCEFEPCPPECKIDDDCKNYCKKSWTPICIEGEDKSEPLLKYCNCYNEKGVSKN